MLALPISLLLGWRNIWRNKRRTIITIVAISFATAILVFSHGLQLSAHRTSVLATTRIFLGAAQVQRNDYFNDPQIYRTISQPDKLAELTDSSTLVAASSIRAVGFALVASEERTYGVQIVGVEPDKEASLSTIPALIRSGSYFSSPQAEEVVIGTTLARNLQVKPGSELTLLGTGRDGSIASAIVKVRGLFETGSSEIDRSLVQLPLQRFQEIFSMPDQAHAIVLQLNSIDDLVDAQRELIAKLKNPSLRVLRWDEIMPGLKQAQEFDRISNWIFHLSLIVIVVFGILNTFLMSLLERTKEFCMLLALGMQPGRITRMILSECAQLVLLGATLGMVLGAGAILYFGKYGFVIPGTQEFLRNWNLPDALYPQISLAALLIGPAVVTCSSLVLLLPFSARPYWLNPVESK